MRLCVYVYITLWFFAARGRLAEIDPIPQLLDFWVKLSWWSRGCEGVSVSEKGFASEAVILDFVRWPMDAKQNYIE